MAEQEQQAIEEGKINPLPKKETIVGITPSFKESLLSYLESRPYNEVSFLVDNLKRSLPFEITING
jgi:hypothetical protein